MKNCNIDKLNKVYFVPSDNHKFDSSLRNTQIQLVKKLISRQLTYVNVVY